MKKVEDTLEFSDWGISVTVAMNALAEDSTLQHPFTASLKAFHEIPVTELTQDFLSGVNVNEIARKYLNKAHPGLLQEAL